MIGFKSYENSLQAFEMLLTFQGRDQMQTFVVLCNLGILTFYSHDLIANSPLQLLHISL